MSMNKSNFIVRIEAQNDVARFTIGGEAKVMKVDELMGVFICPDRPFNDHNSRQLYISSDPVAILLAALNHLPAPVYQELLQHARNLEFGQPCKLPGEIAGKLRGPDEQLPLHEAILGKLLGQITKGAEE